MGKGRGRGGGFVQMYMTPADASATVGTRIRFGVEGGATRERGRGGGQEWKKRDARAISVMCRPKSSKCCITQFMHETWRYRATERGTAPTENTRADPATPNITPSPHPDLARRTHQAPRSRTPPAAGRTPDPGAKSTKTPFGSVTKTMANDRAAPRPHMEGRSSKSRPGQAQAPGDVHRGRPARAFTRERVPRAPHRTRPSHEPTVPCRRGPSPTRRPHRRKPMSERVCLRSPVSVVHRPTIRPCPRDRPEARLDFGGITLGHRALTAPPYRRYRAATEPRRPV